MKFDKFESLKVARDENFIYFVLNDRAYLTVPATWPAKRIIRFLFKRIHDDAWNWRWCGCTSIHYQIKGVAIGPLRRYLTPDAKKPRWEPLLGYRVYGKQQEQEELNLLVEITFFTTPKKEAI